MYRRAVLRSTPTAAAIGLSPSPFNQRRNASLTWTTETSLNAIGPPRRRPSRMTPRPALVDPHGGPMTGNKGGPMPLAKPSATWSHVAGKRHGFESRRPLQIHHGTAGSASRICVGHPPRCGGRSHIRGEEPAVSSVSHRGFTHLGLDVSKDSIAVAVLEPDRDRASVDKIFHDQVSVRRLIGRFEDRSKLWACYEAGPTGYDLYRLLTGLGVRCDVVAPSLIPKRRGDHVKTDKRDARRLAGLHRAGELVAIGVPSPAQEAVRDLCRL